MRTQCERRHNTDVYLARQVRLYKLYNSTVWDSGYKITDWQTGRWKTISWKTCGIRNCSMCGNERRNGWLPKKERITMSERRAYLSYIDGLEEAGL